MAAETPQRPANRLSHETSPYLLQHAHNPVDWYPWGEAAFEKARREHKPIFLSIGYSSCHWCHVMERESFENEEVARLLNDHFVAIKVDREERPDLDDIYMTAVQLLTQRGGWPMSTWLLPDGRPFHGGTYYPRPQFLQLLANIAEVYASRTADVEQNAAQLTQAMAEVMNSREPADTPLTSALVENALSRMGAAYDETFGGFGRAPKFPPSTGLPLLFHAMERSRSAADPLRWATHTLTAMAHGGIHDHLGGGFHRYSTDRQWLVPHFEKMLYDNAQLSRAYAEAFRLTGRPEFREIAEETYDWVLREMTSPDGAFYSSLDADSEGEEGRFYVWTQAEILERLGAEDGGFFCRVYTILPGGNFREEATGRPTGHNILHLTRPLLDWARETGEPLDAFNARLKAMRDTLLAARVQRVWPGLDDKSITAWNGLMIGSLARGGTLLQRPDYLEAAIRAADFFLTQMRPEGRLLRSWRHGPGAPLAVLEDYAHLAHAFLDLHDATGEDRWLHEGVALTDEMIRLFADEEAGAFFNTAADHEAILFRTKASFDQAMPSGNGMAALVLLRLHGLTGDGRYLRRAQGTLGFFLGAMQRNSGGMDTLILAAAVYLEQAGEIASVPALAATAMQGPLSARADLSPDIVAPGGEATLRVTLDIAPGWRVHAETAGDGALEPTRLRLSTGESVSVGRMTSPEATEVVLPWAEAPLAMYQGSVSWELPLHVARDAPAGMATARVFVDAQPCDEERCIAPTTLALEVALRIE